MKKYFAITKAFQMQSMSFRFHFIFSSFGNLFYIVLIYFLWKAIYASSGNVIKGMTFNDTFLYLALATSIFSLFQTYTEWNISRSIGSGMVVMDFIRPLDYQLYVLANRLGFVLTNLVSISIPAILLIVFVFDAQIVLGWNLAFFGMAIVFAYLVSFTIDFMIGLISFYTESIWGISTTKEVVVLLLSGAVIPLPFFPEVMRKVVEWLPFRAIYHIPLKILIDSSLSGRDLTFLLLSQLGWVIVMVLLSRLFFRIASRVITVNGG